MKAAHIALLLGLPLALAAFEVQTGDSLNDVRTTLGAPRGQVKVGNRQLLYYDRGEVELQAGAVTRVALVSVADYAALEAKRTAEAVRRDAENARLDAEGEALRARKLADPSFLAAPLAYQVAYWQDFSRRYPGVPVAEELTIARLRLAEQINGRRAQEERVADLEARASDAEARADAAGSSGYLYGGYGGYGYYGGYGPRHPFSLWPIEYHFSNALGPVVTPFNPSIGSAPPHPTRGTYNNSECDRRDSRGSGRRGRM